MSHLELQITVVCEIPSSSVANFPDLHEDIFVKNNSSGVYIGTLEQLKKAYFKRDPIKFTQKIDLGILEDALIHIPDVYDKDDERCGRALTSESIEEYFTKREDNWHDLANYLHIYANYHAIAFEISDEIKNSEEYKQIVGDFINQKIRLEESKKENAANELALNEAMEWYDGLDSIAKNHVMVIRNNHAAKIANSFHGPTG